MNIIIVCPKDFMGNIEPLAQALESLHGNKVLPILADLDPKPAPKARLAMTLSNEHDYIQMVEQDVQDKPFLLCGIGYHGCRVAHHLAQKHQGRVSGMILCPDENGLDGLSQAQIVKGDDQGFMLCCPALPPIRADDRSDIPYTIVEFFGDAALREGNNRFIKEQGSNSVTKWGIDRRSILCEDLDELVVNPTFIRMFEELAREAARVAQLISQASQWKVVEEELAEETSIH